MLREAIVGEASFWFLLGTCGARSEQRECAAVEIEQPAQDNCPCHVCRLTQTAVHVLAGGRGRCDLLPCTASIGVCPPQWCVFAPVVRVCPSGACLPQWCVSSPVVCVLPSGLCPPQWCAPVVHSLPSGVHYLSDRCTHQPCPTTLRSLPTQATPMFHRPCML
jgi:hypothetical protein